MGKQQKYTHLIQEEKNHWFTRENTNSNIHDTDKRGSSYSICPLYV